MALTKATYSMIDGAYVNVLDFGADLTGATDSTAAIQAAFDSVTGGDGINGTGKTVFFPAGNYLVSATLTVPSVTRVIGAGRWESTLTAASVFTGTSMLTDKGSAAKLTIEHLRFYALPAAATITDVVKLGYTIAFGTEGRLNELLIRGGTDITTTNIARGVNIVGNVGYLQNVTVEYCDTAFNEGVNSTTNSYLVCTAIGQKTYGFNTNTAARIVNSHVEAPSATCIPYYVQRSATVHGASCSLSNDSVASLMTLDAGATGIDVRGLFYTHALAGTATHILTDNRSISSDNPYWADTATEQGSVYDFADARYIRLGRAGYLSYDANYSPRLVGKSAKGAVYSELVHDSDALRMDGVNHRVYPDPTNAIALGYASRQFLEAYLKNGTVVTTPDGTKKYRIAVDNAGAVTSTLVP